MEHIPYIPKEWSRPIERWQDFSVEVYKCRTQEDFDQIETYIDEYKLDDIFIRTYKEALYPKQYRLHVLKQPAQPTYTPPQWGTITNQNTTMTAPVTPSPTDLSKTYEAIDKEQFKAQEPAPIVIEVSGAPEPTNEVVDPLDAIPATPVVVPQEPSASTEVTTETNTTTEESETTVKRKRAQKDPTTNSVSSATKSVTLHRLVKCPIEWIEYSGNEFGMDATGATYEEAKAILDAGFEAFLDDSGLIRTSKVEQMEKIAYSKWLEAGKKIAPPPAPMKRSDADDLELRRYARVQLFMQELAKDLRIAPVMAEIRDKFAVSNPKF